jgi:phosphocarrier protein HPr
MDLSDNKSKKVMVINELGLHARPAAMVAQLARLSESEIWLISNGRQADASSIIDILTIEGIKGTELILRAEKASDMSIVEKIAALFEKGFADEKVHAPDFSSSFQ